MELTLSLIMRIQQLLHSGRTTAPFPSLLGKLERIHRLRYRPMSIVGPWRPRAYWFHAPLLFRMRRAQIRELLQDVGVGLEACGRTMNFGQKGNTIIYTAVR